MMENMNYVICNKGRNLNIHYAVYTSEGDRKVNEDYLLVGSDSNGICFTLSDGLSMYDGGELASRAVCECVIGNMTQFSTHEYSEALLNIYSMAAERVNLMQNNYSEFNKLSATLNTLYISGNTAYLSHIGNARTYFLRNRKIVVKTNDHTQAAVLVKAGTILEDNIRSNRYRKIILKSLGQGYSDSDYEVIRPILVQPGDDFIICSDGLWELIEDETIEKTLPDTADPVKWISGMIKYIEDANIRNKDNISVIAIHIGEVHDDRE